MHNEEIRAPLTGTIIRVDVSPDDVVSTGSPLCLIESMKLEHPLVAPTDGTITDVMVTPGDTVEIGRASCRERV